MPFFLFVHSFSPLLLPPKFALPFSSFFPFILRSRFLRVFFLSFFDHDFFLLSTPSVLPFIFPFLSCFFFFATPGIQWNGSKMQKTKKGAVPCEIAKSKHGPCPSTIPASWRGGPFKSCFNVSFLVKELILWKTSAFSRSCPKVMGRCRL